MATAKLHIGQIVHYRPSVPGYTEDHGDFHIAAIVTMTHNEWTSGAHSTTPGVADFKVTLPQPAEGHVHLFLFPIADANPADESKQPQDMASFRAHYAVAGVPIGQGPGTCSSIPHTAAHA